MHRASSSSRPCRRFSSPWSVALSTALLATSAYGLPLAKGPASPDTQASAKRSDGLASVTTVARLPVADAYVSEATPTTHYGSSPQLSVSPFWTKALYTQQDAYLRFDLRGLPTNARVKSATLQATSDTYHFVPDRESHIHTYFVPDDAWSELGLTWDNRPAVAGESLGRLRIGDRRDHQNSQPALAARVQTELQGDRTLSLRLSSAGAAFSYASREHPDATARPTLTLSYELADACVGPAKPTLVLNGASNMTLQCGVGTWKEPGAKAWDASGPVRVQEYNLGRDDAYGPPDLTQNGRYQIQYVAWAKAGCTVDTLRSVSVVDNIAPTLKLKGAASVEHACGRYWEDPWVEARDLCAGNLSNVVERTGYFDTDKPGVYTLRYDVRDRSGNAAQPVTRTVTVTSCRW